MQQHTSKKPTSSMTVPLRNGFEQREFIVQPEAESSAQKIPSLQARLNRAEQFGHNLGRVQVHANSAIATVQTKSVNPEMAAVQRQEDIDEDETQAKLASQPLQREGEEEDDETQMKSEQSPVQREEAEDEMDM